MRLYHVIYKTGASAEGPFTPAQVVAMFERATSTAQMLVWSQDQKGWGKIGEHIAVIRQEARMALQETASADAAAPALNPASTISEVAAGKVRVIRNGSTIGEYPEEDIAALLRAKVILSDDSYLKQGMRSPAPVSELLLNMVLAPATVAPITAMPASPSLQATPHPMPVAVRRQPGPGEIVCPNANCGYVGPGKKIARGSMIIGILLLLCWILPGVIYFMFFSGYRTCCPRCQCQINNDN